MTQMQLQMTVAEPEDQMLIVEALTFYAERCGAAAKVESTSVIEDVKAKRNATKSATKVAMMLTRQGACERLAGTAAEGLLATVAPSDPDSPTPSPPAQVVATLRPPMTLVQELDAQLDEDDPAPDDVVDVMGMQS